MYFYTRRMYMNEPELEIIYVRVFLKLSFGLQLPSANFCWSGHKFVSTFGDENLRTADIVRWSPKLAAAVGLVLSCYTPL